MAVWLFDSWKTDFTESRLQGGSHTWGEYQSTDEGFRTYCSGKANHGCPSPAPYNNIRVLEARRRTLNPITFDQTYSRRTRIYISFICSDYIDGCTPSGKGVLHRREGTAFRTQEPFSIYHRRSNSKFLVSSRTIQAQRITQFTIAKFVFTSYHDASSRVHFSLFLHLPIPRLGLTSLYLSSPLAGHAFRPLT